MGAADYHLAGEWKSFVAGFQMHGSKAFDGHNSLLPLDGVCTDGLPTYWLSDYFIARTKEDLPTNEHEKALGGFLAAYSVHLAWPNKPESDLPVQSSSVVFRPERVQAIVAGFADIDVREALTWYECVTPKDTPWPREKMETHLMRAIACWREAAKRGDAMLHTEF